METSQIIGQIESAMNPRAIRFKPDLYDSFTAPLHFRHALALLRHANRCTVATAEMIAATHWGMFQFSGLRLYGLGYDRPALDFIESVADQATMFHRLIVAAGIDYGVPELRRDHAKRQLFALRYDGSRDPDLYAARIEEEIVRQDDMRGRVARLVG